MAPAAPPAPGAQEVGGEGEPPPACRTGKVVAAGSVARRGLVGGKGVLQKLEPEQETTDPQLKIEGSKRPKQ